MRDHTFNRPPRVRPRWAAERVELPEPPAPPEPAPTDWAQLVLPLAGAGVFASAASLGGGNPLLVGLPSGALALMGIGAALASRRAAARRAAAQYAERRAYFEDRLESQRARLRRLYDQERSARLYLWPDPGELLLIAGVTGGAPEPRLWERRPDDDDFLDLRVGSGNLPAASQAHVPPPTPAGAVDQRLLHIAAEHATLRQTPISVPLATLGSLGLAGPRPAVLALARALLWQAAVLHAPGDLRLAALYAPASAAEWEWLRWLPHTLPLNNDPSPGLRMLAGRPDVAERLTSDLLDHLSRRRERAARHETAPSAPRILVLVDGDELPGTYTAITELLRHGGPLGIATLLLVSAWSLLPESCAAMLELETHGARWTRAGDQWPRERFSPDQADLAASDQLARHLAGVRLVESGGAQDVPRSVRLFDLLGISDVSELAPPHWWNELPATAWRADVPIGAGADGQPICLDLNESRHGPHGIIAGATGAGKSVLLQSIIAALATTHPPERLQLLLIDFKGGAALMPFATLPHCAGMVTDLEGRLAERAMTAIKSELRRRKEVLKSVATAYSARIENIGDYRALAARAGLPPLPNLLIIVDEFDELARTYPGFVAELIRVVKQGRSLGVHLLLATQQPARAVSNEIRSQLTFFIALRLGSAEDSREMLLKPDAAFLPTDLPGRAFFRVGAETRLMQVAQITTPHRTGSAARAAGPRVSFLRDGREQPVTTMHDPPADQRETDLDILVRALREAAEARALTLAGWEPSRIWQPPLPARLSLAAVSGRVADGWSEPPTGSAWLRQAIGLLDLPQESRREPFSVSLADGHLVAIGAPGSGKTTLLRALVFGLAMSHTPDDLWCYLIDAGGQGLGPLAGLPHVGAHIQARERERVRRLMRMLETTIRERQEVLRAADAADLPALRAGGRRIPAILVVIDKIAVLREEFRDGHGDDEIIDDLIRIARLGRTYGVHLALSADRATDLTYRLLSLMEIRIALRLPELHDYSDLLGARVSAPIPQHLPGRALVMHPDYGPLDLHIALPGLDGDGAGGEAIEERPGALDAELTIELRQQAARLRAEWRERGAGAGPAPIELLPERLSLASLKAASEDPAPGDALSAPIGRESLTLGPAWLHLSQETPHALIIGPRRSGKTGALLCAASALIARYGPEELALFILDGPRGGLRPLRALPHTMLYVDDEAGAAMLRASLLAARAEAPARRRLVLIDDYTLCRERMRAQLTQNFGGEPNLHELLTEIAQVGGQHGEHLLVAAGVAYADDNLLRALDAGRAGLLLWPGRYDPGTRLLGVALPLADQRASEQPPGRALLVRDEERELVQLAQADAVWPS
ncbi:MAG: FtsK/SpoIIIE domain-containing protein [Oscillochloridaceae bacterium]|nr:FtsK/SpoIIIE domain-containing protein [Chloroflexaceae bacterium]MDW8390072.1 FtsK/SpoIIIE domain-containing protein [Oscillochloridaceae bacterium]